MIPAFLGAMLMLVAIFVKTYRAPWFFWFMIVSGVILALNYPETTFLGAALLIYLLWKKDEFLSIDHKSKTLSWSAGPEA